MGSDQRHSGLLKTFSHIEHSTASWTKHPLVKVAYEMEHSLSRGTAPNALNILGALEAMFSTIQLYHCYITELPFTCEVIHL